MRGDMALKKLTFHTLYFPWMQLSFLYITILGMPEWLTGCSITITIKNCVFILHITTTRPMHYAPHVPASHDGSNAKAMQDENYAWLCYALWKSLLYLNFVGFQKIGYLAVSWKGDMGCQVSRFPSLSLFFWFPGVRNQWKLNSLFTDDYQRSKTLMNVHLMYMEGWCTSRVCIIQKVIIM